jgi:hypothetical protein
MSKFQKWMFGNAQFPRAVRESSVSVHAGTRGGLFLFSTWVWSFLVVNGEPLRNPVREGLRTIWPEFIPETHRSQAEYTF